MSDWEDRLRAMGDAVRPTDDVTTPVRRRLARRRRRAFTAAGIAGVAGAAVLTATAVAGRSPGAGVAVDPNVADHSTATTGPTGRGSIVPGQDFTCPTDSKVFDKAAAPPIPDLAGQRSTISTIEGLVRNSYTVRYAEPTALGVIAFVEGDLGTARSALASYGVTHVWAWGPDDPSAGGLDGPGQVAQAMDWLIDPAISAVRRATSGWAGRGEFALWKDAGAVLLQWKRPVPAAVSALATRTWGDGVRLVIEPTTYSAHELLNAQGHVAAIWRRYRQVTSIYRCGDASGLVVGVDPKRFPHDPRALERELAGIAGVPVMLTREGPVRELDGRATVSGGQQRVGWRPCC